MKDYYKILEVPPAASLDDIKKSYRRLAFQYHPDKNFGTEISETRFKEILEAYKILSDTKKRNDYNYSRLKTNTEANYRKSPPTVTPISILYESIEFRKKILKLDPDRMNKQAVYQQIQYLLSKQNIQLLQKNADVNINRKIVDEILVCSRHLPFVFVEKICFQLAAIAGADNNLYQKIYAFSKKVRLQTYWNKYKVIAALLFSIIICFLIFIVSKGI